MLNATCMTPSHRPSWSRKIQLDCNLYCSHSVRASAGDAECDHDFEAAPTVAKADFAAWTCTRCGRVFRYEIWKSDNLGASKESTHALEDRTDVGFLADGGMLLCDPAAF